MTVPASPDCMIGVPEPGDVLERAPGSRTAIMSAGMGGRDTMIGVSEPRDVLGRAPGSRAMIMVAAAAGAAPQHPGAPAPPAPAQAPARYPPHPTAQRDVPQHPTASVAT